MRLGESLNFGSNSDDNIPVGVNLASQNFLEYHTDIVSYFKNLPHDNDVNLSQIMNEFFGKNADILHGARKKQHICKKVLTFAYTDEPVSAPRSRAEHSHLITR